MTVREAAVAGILLGERGPGVAIGQRVRAELTEFPGAAERGITFRRVDLPAADSPAARR
jgi:hypothetical protein